MPFDGQIGSKTEEELAEFISQFWGFPYEFVMAVFPWGEPTLADGSVNPLANKTGPEPWQKGILEKLGWHIRNGATLQEIGLELEPWMSAVASGHGVGKSALVAWLVYFFMSTRTDTRGVVTASTQFQLEDKTWPELAKWHNLALNKHWFNWSATSFWFAAYDDDRRKNYMFTAATVSEHKTEAFQGLHNEGRSVIVIFDEASGVFPKIWGAAMGALTDGEAFFFAFGNPTRPEGEFYDCFNTNAALFYKWHVDSREVSHTNKTAIQLLIRKYGIDHDEVKIRVLGLFPNMSFNGFIGVDVVNLAMTRELVQDFGAGLIMAVDVARFGDDETVIGWRQGRDARSRPCIRMRNRNNVEVARIVAEQINKTRPDAVVIEAVGPGIGVIDILRDAGYRVHEVYPGAQADHTDRYINKRAELWSKMRDWLYAEGCIPTDASLTAGVAANDNDNSLFKQLTAIMYTLREETKLQMEAKKDMKARGLKSPDEADMLALTFAVSVPRRDMHRIYGQGRNNVVQQLDPLEAHFGEAA